MPRLQATKRHRSGFSKATPKINSLARLLDQESAIGETQVNGWVRSVRKQKKIAFAAIGDGSTMEPLQAVMKPEVADG